MSEIQYLGVIHLSGSCYHIAMLEPKLQLKVELQMKFFLSTP